MPKNSRNKGFTLVEVIVAFGLLTLIIGITAPLIMSAMSTFSRGQRLAQAKQMGLGAYEYIEARVSPSLAVTLGGQNPGDAFSAITVADGLLTLDGEAVYSRELCGGLEFSLDVSASESTLLQITLKISDGGRVVFAKTSAFRLINMQKSGGEIAFYSSDAIYFTTLEAAYV